MAIQDSVLNIVIKAKNQAGKGLNELNSQLGRTAGVGNGAKLALAGIGIAAAGMAIKLGVDSVKAAVEFESKMAEVRKTTGFSAEETKKFGREILDMSRHLPVAQEQLADIAGVAGQLGIQGSENIKKFTEIIAKATIALPEFSGGAEEIALVVAKTQNVFKLTVAESENLLSAWNELSNTTAANAAEIARFTENVGGAASIMKISSDKAAALGATLVSMGEDGSDAGTRVSSAIIFMQKHLDDAAKVAGTSTAEFKKRLDENALKAVEDVIRGLEKIPSATDRNVAAMDIFGQIGGKVMTKLTGNLDQLDKNLKVSEEGFKNNTSLLAEFGVQSETAAAQWQQLNNNFKATKTIVGEQILPVLNKALRALNDFFASQDKLGEFSKIVKKIPIVGKISQSNLNPFNMFSQGLADLGVIKGYATGGIVPGPKGAAQMAVVHGGEKITSNGGGGSSIVINFNNSTITDEGIIEKIKKAIRRESELTYQGAR